jgi:hypothetical protein
MVARVAAASLLVVQLLVTALPMRALPIDDKFIVAVYARNLVEGRGWVYNAGEAINASTSTLNPLLGAAAGLFGAPIPAALWWISFFAAAMAVSLLVVTRGREETWGAPVRGLWIAVSLASSPLFAATFGLESALFALGFVTVGLAVDHAHWRIAYLAAGLLCLVRGEAMLIAALLVPLDIWRRRRMPLPDALLLLVPTLPWGLHSWMQFGSPLPSTLGTKRLQGASGLFGAGDVGGGLWELLVSHTSLRSALVITLAAFAILGARRWRPSVALFTAFGAITLTVYWWWMIPVASYFWYAAPFLLCALWLAGEGLAEIVRLMGPRAGLPFAAVLLAAALTTRGDVGPWFHERYAPKQIEATLYAEAGAWIDAMASPEAAVAVTEIGQNGWHMRRRLLDLAGLLSPEIAQTLFADFDLTGWLGPHEPDFILMREPNDRAIHAQLLGRPGFREAYEEQATFTSDDGAVAMHVYAHVAEFADAQEEVNAEMRMASEDEESRRLLRAANSARDFTHAIVTGRLEPSGSLAMEVRPGEGISLEVNGPDAYLWLPWADVRPETVRAVRVTIALEAERRTHGVPIQLTWRGADEAHETLRGDGLMESVAPLNSGLVEVTFPVGRHPNWLRMAWIRRLRIDPGPPGTRALLRRVELIPWTE